MQQNNLVEKINELVSDKEYVKHLMSLGSLEEMSKELEKKDIDLSPDELRKIGQLIKKKESGELTDEELEEVAGGFVGWLVAAGIVGAALSGAGLYYGTKYAFC